MEQLLRDCSADGFEKRLGTARKIMNHKLHGLVKPGSRRLRVALITKPSEADMDLSLLDLAVGDTMFVACNRIRDLVRPCVGLAGAVGRMWVQVRT